MATSTLGSGTLVLAGTTSGTTTVTATAVAGTTTLTLPAATDTLVGKATTDTLTNKTLTGAAMNGTLGATTPSTVAATTLTTSSTVTHNGGTANGVGYLDGSKVLTTGSALVFDGTNLGLGTASPYSAAGYSSLTLNNTTGSQIRMRSSGTDIGLIFNTASALNVYTSGAIPLVFSTNDTERARIDSSGNLLAGKTASSLGTVGHEFFAVGAVYHTRNADPVLLINRLTNDGNLVEFYQAGTLEGAISVSGTTVTYGGGHLARFGQLPDGSEDPTLLKGTVLTNLNEMCVWINKETGIPADNEQCNKVKISDVDGDANVAGVFVSWAYDEQHDTNDLYVAMTGDMIIRIAQGTTVARGDLLMSAGDGTAKPQGDDIVRSKTVAKVTSTHVTCTYADGSYCVPCVLMAC